MKSTRIFLYATLVLVAFLWLVPLMGLFSASIRTLDDLLAGWWTIPKEFVAYHNYYVAFVGGEQAFTGLWKFTLNSVIISIFATVLPILISSLAAYALVKQKLRFSSSIFLLIVSGEMIPSQVVLIPVYKVLSDLRLIDSFLGIILVHTAMAIPFTTFVLANFFQEIPKEISESAKIDGSSELGTFLRIILPLSIPALAALAILQFIWVWNEFLFSLTFLRTSATQPLTIGLVLLKGRRGANWPIVSAGAIISIALPLIIFAAFQKYFVRGIVAGAVKG